MKRELQTRVTIGLPAVHVPGFLDLPPLISREYVKTYWRVIFSIYYVAFVVFSRKIIKITHFLTGFAGTVGLWYTYGIRGRKKLVVNEYTFYKFSSAKLSQTWYCSQRKAKRCRASVRLYMAGKWDVVIGDHTHPPTKPNGPLYQTNGVCDIYFDDSECFGGKPKKDSDDSD